MSWENNVRKVEPYVPGEQPKVTNIIKLNTNECPYPPSAQIQEKLKEFEIDKLRLYPDTAGEPLRSVLADYYSLKKEQVFVGVGSDDVLATAFLTFFNSDKPVLFPDITYSFYDVWAELYRIPYKRLPLKEDFHIDPADYMQENGGIIFPNPNAPTGLMETVDSIRSILEKNRDVVVIIDEAYVDFGGESVLPLLAEYENLLVVQTFSKSRAMAGMRVGFAMGNEKIIRYLNDAKNSINSYTMNYPTLALAAEAVTDDAYFKKLTGMVINTREWTKAELIKLGFNFPDSKSNFIFATHATAKAKDIFEYLKSKNIFVRYFNKPRIDNYLRISIGTREEMETLIHELKTYLA